MVALGIDTMGAKHPLGLWEGATENATVCQGRLTNLGSRGLRTDRSLLVTRRWREGPRHGRDPDIRARRAGAAVSGP